MQNINRLCALLLSIICIVPRAHTSDACSGADVQYEIYGVASCLIGGIVGHACGSYLRNTLYQQRRALEHLRNRELSLNAGLSEAYQKLQNKQSNIKDIVNTYRAHIDHNLSCANNHVDMCQQNRQCSMNRLALLMERFTKSEFLCDTKYARRRYTDMLRKNKTDDDASHNAGQYALQCLQEIKHVKDHDLPALHDTYDKFIRMSERAVRSHTYDEARSYLEQMCEYAQELRNRAGSLQDVYRRYAQAKQETMHDIVRRTHTIDTMHNTCIDDINAIERNTRNMVAYRWSEYQPGNATCHHTTACTQALSDMATSVTNHIDNWARQSNTVFSTVQKHINTSSDRNTRQYLPMTWTERFLPCGMACIGVCVSYGISYLLGYV